MANCKPGDLAQVVRIGSDPCMRHFLGATVTVRVPFFLGDGISWTYDEKPKRCRACDDCLTTFPDDALKPIRGDAGEHPGDVLVTPGEKKLDPILNPLVERPKETTR